MIDYQIFRVINSLAGRDIYLDRFFIFLAVWLIFVIAGLALIYTLLLAGGAMRRKIFVRLFVATAAAWLFNNFVVVYFYFRSRPFISHHVVRLITPLSAKSFPSDHATIAFAMAITISYVNKRWGRWLIYLAVLVALGRVLVGVHYPSDVIAGALVGWLFAYFAKRLIV